MQDSESAGEAILLRAVAHLTRSLRVHALQHGLSLPAAVSFTMHVDAFGLEVHAFVSLQILLIGLLRDVTLKIACTRQKVKPPRPTRELVVGVLHLTAGQPPAARSEGAGALTLQRRARPARLVSSLTAAVLHDHARAYTKAEHWVISGLE